MPYPERRSTGPLWIVVSLLLHALVFAALAAWVVQDRIEEVREVFEPSISAGSLASERLALEIRETIVALPSPFPSEDRLDPKGSAERSSSRQPDPSAPKRRPPTALTPNGPDMIETLALPNLTPSPLPESAPLIVPTTAAERPPPMLRRPGRDRNLPTLPPATSTEQQPAFAPLEEAPPPKVTPNLPQPDLPNRGVKPTGKSRAPVFDPARSNRPNRVPSAELPKAPQTPPPLSPLERNPIQPAPAPTTLPNSRRLRPQPTVPVRGTKEPGPPPTAETSARTVSPVLDPNQNKPTGLDELEEAPRETPVMIRRPSLNPGAQNLPSTPVPEPSSKPTLPPRRPTVSTQRIPPLIARTSSPRSPNLPSFPPSGVDFPAPPVAEEEPEAPPPLELPTVPTTPAIPAIPTTPAVPAAPANLPPPPIVEEKPEAKAPANPPMTSSGTPPRTPSGNPTPAVPGTNLPKGPGTPSAPTSPSIFSPGPGNIPKPPPPIELKPEPPSPPEIDVKPEPPPTEEFELRDPETREKKIEALGGDALTEAAINRALNAFARRQRSDGSWPASPGTTEIDQTGLVLLTFLGAGITHKSEHPHRLVVERGLNALMGSQASDGTIRVSTKPSQVPSLHDQAVATLALAEAFSMAPTPRLREALQLAVGPIVRASDASSGGWKTVMAEHAANPSAASPLSWSLLALKRAREAGIVVPAQSLIAAEEWMASHNPPTAKAAAEAMYCLQLLGEPPRAILGFEARRFAGSEEILPSVRGPRDFELWHHGSMALRSYGGPLWEDWNNRIKTVLLFSQNRTGARSGLWDQKSAGRAGSSRDNGKLRASALAVLTLEVYYRYNP